MLCAFIDTIVGMKYKIANSKAGLGQTAAVCLGTQIAHPADLTLTLTLTLVTV